MTEINQVLKCDLCGNIVEVLHTGASVIICCGQEMKTLVPNTADAAQKKPTSAKATEDKHVPVIEKTDTGYRISVGSVLHPMENTHFIEWIELVVGQNIYRQNLKPGDEPVVEFSIDTEVSEVRAYCNLHGLWKA